MRGGSPGTGREKQRDSKLVSGHTPWRCIVYTTQPKGRGSAQRAPIHHSTTHTREMNAWIRSGFHCDEKKTDRTSTRNTTTTKPLYTIYLKQNKMYALGDKQRMT